MELWEFADLPKHEQALDRIRTMGRHAQRLAIRVAANAHSGWSL